ncbi:MAG: hypothetical protein ACK456_10455 [Pseudanabaenaceae cyanobacterium]|jgi:uncharacterized protein YfcZ (UPF0381/DUF406 family)
MEPVSLLVGLLLVVGTGSLTKVGENITDGTVKLARSWWSVLKQKAPDTATVKAISAGEDFDPRQAVIDVETIADDPEVTALLAQVKSLLASNQELAAKVEELASQAKSENIQVGARDFEADELDAEVEQKILPTESKAVKKQTGFDNVKIKGKATIKLNQQIN